MEQDRIRWDGRYADQPLAVASAPDVVADHEELLAVVPTSGRALDVACGAGGQSLWLAERGLDVVALDVSPVAIDLLRKAASSQGHTGSLDARVHDTEGGLPADLTDLSLIVCQRYRATPLYSEFITRLRLGGVLVLTVLSAVGLDGTPGEFHAPEGELIEALLRADVEVLIHEERNGQASIVVKRVSWPDA